MNLFVEFKNQRQTFDVIDRQETGAAYKADGCHRATGKLAVVMVTSGPRSDPRTYKCVMNAQADGSAMQAITGEVDEKYFGKGPLEEKVDCGLDVKAVFGTAVQYSTQITSESQFQTLLQQALRDALSIPRRAAHLGIPVNVTAQSIAAVSIPFATECDRRLRAGFRRTK